MFREYKLYIPKCLLSNLLVIEIHGVGSMGHFGISKTFGYYNTKELQNMGTILSHVEFAYNKSVYSVTKFSPFENCVFF